MEQIKCVKAAMPLRNYFILHVLVTFILVIALSGLVIWGCLSVQHRLLPESDAVYLNIELTYPDGTKSKGYSLVRIGDDPNQAPYMLDEKTDLQTLIGAKYSITSVETSFSSLSPKRQLLYRACSAAMVALPILFSLSGILFCGFFFYRKRLKTPIELLTQATDKITEQDLDFHISYSVNDELGALCDSFEQMRIALQENNQKMWDMLEERKNLQASVAHDLRNPIAIIEGHAEYLQLNLPAGDLSRKKIEAIAGNIRQAADRLARYTDSMQTVNHLEDLEIKRRPVDFSALHHDMVLDFTTMAEPSGIALATENLVAAETVELDPQVLYRILENLIGNALRYAKQEIRLSFCIRENKLSVCVADDGPGFPERVLKGTRFFLASSCDGNHAGIGLTICRILCKKHGGNLSIHNAAAGGAQIRFTLRI